MLSPNFNEIIAVVLEKSEKNALETLTSEDIRSISMMLLGYLRLIKAEFKTKNDSSEPGDGYYAQLKAILKLLTDTQNKLIQKRKKEFINEFNADIDGFINQLNSAINIHEMSPNFNKFMTEFTQAIAESLSNSPVGFTDATNSVYHLSSSVMELIERLERINKRVLVSENHFSRLFQKTVTHYLNKWIPWIDIENTNLQCVSYVKHDNFMNL